MNEAPSLRLAEAWWAAHAPTGVFGSPDGEESAEEIDDALEMEQAVARFVKAPDTLGRMIELLVVALPSTSSLSYIGTWHLENAYQALGEQALERFDETDLPASVKQEILSGFLR